MKTPYTLSTDYAELFDLIQDGTHYLGISNEGPVVVYKLAGGYRITSQDIIRYLQGRDNPTFQDFERICQQTNLKWIKP